MVYKWNSQRICLDGWVATCTVATGDGRGAENFVMISGFGRPEREPSIGSPGCRMVTTKVHKQCHRKSLISKDSCDEALDCTLLLLVP